MNDWKFWHTGNDVNWYVNIETAEVRGIARGDGKVVTQYKNSDGSYATPLEMSASKLTSSEMLQKRARKAGL